MINFQQGKTRSLKKKKKENSFSYFFIFGLDCSPIQDPSPIQKAQLTGCTGPFGFRKEQCKIWPREGPKNTLRKKPGGCLRGINELECHVGTIIRLPVSTHSMKKAKSRHEIITI
jgi:hypothetical protein